MDTTTDVATPIATGTLTLAAIIAARAPSIHNTQPWRWRIRDGVADLYADRHRQLFESDPDGRMMITSCGVALNHLCVALEAAGFLPEITRIPDAAHRDHLARVTIAGRVPTTPGAMRRLQTLEIRRTDRRALSDQPLPDGAIDTLRSTIAHHMINLIPLNRDEVIELAVAIGHAQRGQVEDPAGATELAAWTGWHRLSGAGIPDANIPADPVETTVPARDFGHMGTLTGGEGHDSAARHVILYGLNDEPSTWLRAGEALSELWLAATEIGISVLPMSAAVESPATRVEMRRILGGIGYPCIAVRLGIADPDQPTPPPTPRLPISTTVDAESVPAE
jgi:nitroreductase